MEVDMIALAALATATLGSGGAGALGIKLLNWRQDRSIAKVALQTAQANAAMTEARLRKMLNAENLEVRTQLVGVHQLLKECNDRHDQSDREKLERRAFNNQRLAVMQAELDKCMEARGA